MPLFKENLILAVKDLGTANESNKARIKAQAIVKTDSDKNMFMNDSNTVNKSSLRLMMKISADKRLYIFMSDIS